MRPFSIIAILAASLCIITGSNGQDPQADYQNDVPYSGMLADAGEVNPEEVEMDKSIAEYRETMCFAIFGDCWLAMKISKQRYTEDQRTKLCMKKIRGFAICSAISDDRIESAKAEAERQQKENIEMQRRLRILEIKREKMLAKEEEVAKLRWERLKEKSKAKRLEKAMLTSTPGQANNEATTAAAA